MVEVRSLNYAADLHPADLECITIIQSKIFGGSSSADDLNKRLTAEHKPFISMAYHQQELIGYAIGFEKKSKYYIWMLGVLEGHRGMGTATKLIEDQTRHAMKGGYSVVSVKSSPKWKEMLRLLIKLDFIIIGYKANEWGSFGAVWFEKQIKS